MPDEITEHLSATLVLAPVRDFATTVTDEGQKVELAGVLGASEGYLKARDQEIVHRIDRVLDRLEMNPQIPLSKKELTQLRDDIRNDYE